MLAKYDGSCAECGGAIFKGDDIAYDPATRKARHLECACLIDAKNDLNAIAERLGFKAFDPEKGV